MQEINLVSIICFILFIGITLLITYWASKKNKTTNDFYTAGRSIGALKNGLALAGDYISSASFLGITGMVALKGYDGLIYAIGFLVGWPFLLFMVAEPLRNLGKFTVADVVSFRFSQKPVRIASAIGSLSILLFYLIAQMVGGGGLIKLLFHIPYELSVIIVGAVMIIYVLFGGMLATTWVQIIKASLLIISTSIIAFLTLLAFGFNIESMAGMAIEKYGAKVLSPGSYISNPYDAISLGMALIFGTAGLPHILVKFYTVPNARVARNSVLYATVFTGYFYILLFILGFGAMLLVNQDAIKAVDVAGNMAALQLSEVLGGEVLFGIIGAIAFATMLAVVAGLTISGAGTIAHDLYVNVFSSNKPRTDKEQVKVAKYSVVGLGVVAIILGLVFKGQNVAYMVGLAFAIAASANLPSLFLSFAWKKYTTAGAVASCLSGVLSALILILFSPIIWVNILGHEKAIFPLSNPAIVSLPLAIIVGVVVSLFTKDSKAEEIYKETRARTYLGVDAH